MTVIVVVWLVLLALGLVGWAIVWMCPSLDQDARVAVRLTGASLLPAVLPITEYVFRWLEDRWSVGLSVRWYFMTGTLLSVLLFVASFVDVPLGRIKAKWEIVRLVQLGAWLGGMLVAVGMVLDV